MTSESVKKYDIILLINFRDPMDLMAKVVQLDYQVKYFILTFCNRYCNRI